MAHICIICGNADINFPNPEIKACRACVAFYKRVTKEKEQLKQEDAPYSCEFDSKCEIKFNIRSRMCKACRYRICKETICVGEKTEKSFEEKKLEKGLSPRNCKGTLAQSVETVWLVTGMGL